MVEMALRDLGERQVVTLDEERKAAMVSNLLVVLCSETEAHPVINAGTITLPDILEGQHANLSFSFFDPGLLDLYDITIDWGDGAGAIDMTAVGVLNSDPAGNHTFTVTSP